MGWFDSAAKILGGGSLLGSYFDSKEADRQQDAAKSARNVQAQHFDQALDFQKDVFAKNEARLQPFIDGSSDSYQLQQALSGALGPEQQQAAFDNYQESPGVSFLREEGLRGINQNASASGRLGGADRLKSISKFNQGLALQDFNQQFSRLGSITGTGLSAASALSGIATNNANAQSGLLQNRGNAYAQGQLNIGDARAQKQNAFASGVNNLADIATKAVMGGFSPI